MWKKVFLHVHEGFAIEVSKTQRGQRTDYSFKLGKHRPDGGEHVVLPFFDPDKLTDVAMIALTKEARGFVANYRERDAQAEKRRLDELSGKGKSRNPHANTGLSRFKKKREEKREAT